MFCSEKKKSIGDSEHPNASQRKLARQRGQLFCDDIMVFQLILQGFGIFKPHHHAKYFCAQRQKAFNQGFSRLGTNLSLPPFVVLHDFFVF